MNEWICPDCGGRITGPCYPRLHTCKLYEYEFSIWPHEKWDYEKEIFEVFELLKGRIAFNWTEKHFNRVRSILSHHGLVMHEITRRLYTKEELVL